MQTLPKFNVYALTSLLLTLCLAACDSPEVQNKVSQDLDPWYLAPPQSDLVPEPVSSSTYYPVTAERTAEAEEFLQEIGTSQISPGEIAYFVGHDVELPDVDRPFLVRGLYRSNSAQTIDILGNALWVRSADNPSDKAPLKRQPLVLIMQEVPELVYVTTGQ